LLDDEKVKNNAEKMAIISKKKSVQNLEKVKNYKR